MQSTPVGPRRRQAGCSRTDRHEGLGHVVRPTVHDFGEVFRAGFVDVGCVVWNLIHATAEFVAVTSGIKSVGEGVGAQTFGVSGNSAHVAAWPELPTVTGFHE